MSSFKTGASQLAVLVVNFHSSTDVNLLLESMTHSCDVLVSIVDNSDSDDEFGRLEEIAAKWRHAFGHVIVTPAATNLGYGAGNNLAFEMIREHPFSTVLIANPDTRMTSGNLVEAAHMVAATGGPSLYATPTSCGGTVTSGISRLSPFSARVRPGRSRVPYPDLTYPGGHFLFVSRDSWEALEGFDQNFFLYCEELDMALRARNVGMTIGVIESVAVRHEGDGLIGAREGVSGKAIIGIYHANRSRMILYRRHRTLWPFVLPMAAVRLIMAGLLVVIGRGPQGAALARGILHGLHHALRETV